jgi:hypothetical protein
MNGYIPFIYFDGTVLRHPDGRRFVLCLHWRKDGWDKFAHWLDGAWYADRVSAVLTR